MYKIGLEEGYSWSINHNLLDVILVSHIRMDVFNAFLITTVVLSDISSKKIGLQLKLL